MPAPVHHRELQLLQTLPDAELVAHLREGETAPFELIMRRHNRRLFRIARGILKDDGEAEDAVQETYVCAWLKLGQFRGPDSFASWLCRIATNEALMRRRRLQRTRLNVSGVDQVPELHSPAPDPAAQLHEAQLRRLLEGAIDDLPEVYRDAFVLREVGQMSVAETACSLGIEEGAVKTRVHRARKLLQRNLSEELSAAIKGAYEFDGARCDRLVANVTQRIAALRVH